MAATVRPRGPLPPRVYWTRRLLVLGVPLLLVVVLARVLGGAGDGNDGAKATQAGARTTAKAPAAGPLVGPTAPSPREARRAARRARKEAEAQPPPEPVLAEPSGPCDDADVVATPALAQAAGGADVPITLNLRTLVADACTWHISPATLTVTITSGPDHIWSSRECPASIPVQDVVVRQEVDTPVVVTWHARRSDETCSRWTDWAELGWYHVQAAALGGEATDVQFELVAPAPAVVTKTVEPKPAGAGRGKGKGKKTQQQDTTHQPGEDGAGNSAG